MEISGMTALLSMQQRESGSAAQIQKAGDRDYSRASDQELLGACKEFEAYFLEQMMKQMWKTVPESEESSAASSAQKEYYREEMFRELAAEEVRTGGLGLAQMLYEQMKRNYE